METTLTTGVKYFYLRTKTRVPFGCVATNVTGNAETGIILNVGYSLCNPKDRFNRPRARHIATARLGRLISNVPVGSDVHSIRELALKLLSDEGRIPNYLRIEVRRALSELQLVREQQKEPLLYSEASNGLAFVAG